MSEQKFPRRFRICLLVFLTIISWIASYGIYTILKDLVS